MRTVFSLIAIIFVLHVEAASTTFYQKGFRKEKNGWIYVHIEGSAYERGVQYGYLIADLYQKYVDIYRAMTPLTTGVEYNFFVDKAVELHRPHIPEELLQEMQGIADGMTKAGHSTTLEEIIGWNGYLEILSNWWSKAKKGLSASFPDYLDGHCSAFIATGMATVNNQIVIGHSTFDSFWNGQVCNFILDLVPAKGAAITMQATPGYVSSLTDFFINSEGIVAVETTIAGCKSYDATKTPYFVRTRNAIQYGKTIDEFVQLLNKNNSGGMAASWLIGDIKTNEIAKYEQGLYYQSVEKKSEGYYFGCNTVDNLKLRFLECDETGYNDIRQSIGGRRVRFPVLLEKFYGEIDDVQGQKFLSDHYDVYHKRNSPAANTICQHADVDPRYSMSSPLSGTPYPYMPKGCLDGKVTTSFLAKDRKFYARWGRACGISFSVKEFMKKNPQWQWQEKYLFDRPTKPWTLFMPLEEN